MLSNFNFGWSVKRSKFNFGNLTILDSGSLGFWDFVEFESLDVLAPKV